MTDKKEEIKMIENLKTNLIPDEKNYKLIRQKMIDANKLTKIEFEKDLKIFKSSEKPCNFQTNFNSESIENLKKLLHQFFNSEDIYNDKTSNLKNLESKKNEIINFEMSESSIIHSLLNSQNDKQNFIDDKTKEFDSIIRDKESKIIEIEIEFNNYQEKIKNLLSQINIISKENKLIVENVYYFSYFIIIIQF